MKKALLTLCAALGCLILSAQAPANDNCEEAIAVSTGETVEFSTVDATEMGPLHDCPSAADSIFNDIWYSYTADFTGQALWSLCGGGTDFDSKVAVYVGGAACPVEAADLLICNDDGNSPTCDLASEALFDVVSGEAYLLRLGGYGDEGETEEGTGSFTITEFIPSLPNDLCSDAIEIGLVENFDVSNIDATTDGPSHPGDPNGCFGFNDPQAGSDIWYSFTPDFDGFVQWSTCSTVSFDSRLVVYGPNVACPPTADDLYACNDDGPGCQNFTSAVTFEVQSGQTYLLRMGGFGGEQGRGTFNLVEVEPAVPPANDDCANADSIYVLSMEQANNFEVVFEGTTINGTFNSGEFVFPQCLSNQDGGEFADVWYKFNTLGNTQLEMRLNTETEGAFFFVDLFMDCGSGQLDTLDFPGSCMLTTEEEPFVTSVISGLPEEPTELLLRVSTRLTSDPPGDFFLQLAGDIISNTRQPAVVEHIRAFPNPSRKRLNTSFNLVESSEVELSVIDLLGKRVYSRFFGKLPSGLHEEQLNVSLLPAGIYFLRISANGQSHSVKFIKE